MGGQYVNTCSPPDYTIREEKKFGLLKTRVYEILSHESGKPFLLVRAYVWTKKIGSGFEFDYTPDLWSLV